MCVCVCACVCVCVCARARVCVQFRLYNKCIFHQIVYMPAYLCPSVSLSVCVCLSSCICVMHFSIYLHRGSKHRITIITFASTTIATRLSKQRQQQPGQKSNVICNGNSETIAVKHGGYGHRRI